ncbi:MAG: MucR family transcriptional regulator [Hyphomonas sp.]|nr:MucR family transcriptional regulator [Hyphomonas sp.]
MEENDLDLVLEQVAKIVASYVKNNHITPTELPVLIALVGRSLVGSARTASNVVGAKPTVSVSASIRAHRLVCLECGRTFKTLKKHLMAAHGLTPEDYRRRYCLTPDYPMVAPTDSRRWPKPAGDRGRGRQTQQKPSDPA